MKNYSIDNRKSSKETGIYARNNKRIVLHVTSLFIHFSRLCISSNDYLEVNPYHGCRTDDMSLYHAYRTSLPLFSRIVSRFNETVHSNDSLILLNGACVQFSKQPNTVLHIAASFVISNILPIVISHYFQTNEKLVTSGYLYFDNLKSPKV